MSKSEEEAAPKLHLHIRKGRRGLHFVLTQIIGSKVLSQGWVDGGDPEAVRAMVRTYIEFRFPKTKPDFTEEMTR